MQQLKFVQVICNFHFELLGLRLLCVNLKFVSFSSVFIFLNIIIIKQYKYLIYNFSKIKR